MRESKNEIGSIKRLLDQLDIEGQTITIDAIGTQREIAGQIIGKKARYLLALKAKQPALHKQAIDPFDFGLRYLNLLNNDTGVIKSMAQKRLRALMNQSYRERLLSLA